MLRAHAREKDVNDQDFIIFGVEYGLVECLEPATKLASPRQQIKQ
jgi:hypothetical protein